MKLNKIKLGKKVISNASTPYFIAEIGVNHENSLSRAKKLILLAKKGGADGVKFQTYKAETLASKKSPSYWDTKQIKIRSQFELFKKFDHFNFEDYKTLALFCKKNKIDFLSTPFDTDSVNFLNKFVPFFKIASADITNFPLIRCIARKKKPVVLSTGSSNINDIKVAIFELNKYGCKKIVVLHCILNYPTKYNNANLNMINYLKNIFPDKLIGFSDHTYPDDEMRVLVTAYTKGARVIEKHFTDNKKLKGNDHFHSLDCNDLSTFIKKVNFINTIEGKPERIVLESEKISRKNARRSVYTKKKIKKGEILNEQNIIPKRPGNGISPIYWDKLIGKKVIKNLEEDVEIKWEHIKK